MTPFELTVRKATVAAAAGAFRRDAGIRGGRIGARSVRIEPGRAEIDASNRPVLPDSVDRRIDHRSRAGVPAPVRIERRGPAARRPIT